MANFCTNCGVSLPNDVKFCTDCGNKIEQDISDEDKSKESEEVKEVEKVEKVQKVEEVKEVEKFENKTETTQETPESPVNTFCRGDESLEELLKMVSLQKEQKTKLGVLRLITATIKPSRPDTYNQFIQKLREIEPEFIESLAKENEDGEKSFRKKSNFQNSPNKSEINLKTEKKQLLIIIYYVIATIPAIFYGYNLNIFNDSLTSGLFSVLGLLLIPALISYAINRIKSKEFNNYSFSKAFAISSVIIIGIAYLGNTRKSSSDDTINELVQKPIEKSETISSEKIILQKEREELARKEAERRKELARKEADRKEKARQLAQREREIERKKELAEKEGGIIIFEQNGHGIIAAKKDLGKMDWYEAKNACADLFLNGFSDWRLPTKKELNMMYLQKSTLGIDKGGYWSSSGEGLGAWWVSFYAGSDYAALKSNTLRVRAVRAF